MHKRFSKGLVWFRRDLRTHDHAALSAALQQCDQVYCAFVLDTHILTGLPTQDRRVEFILASLREVDASLRAMSAHQRAGLIRVHARAREAIPRLANDLQVDVVFAAQDYEPSAIARDADVAHALREHARTLVLLKDHVIFQERELLTATGKPYSVYTPYARAWRARVGEAPLHSHAVSAFAGALAPLPQDLSNTDCSLEQLGFAPTNLAELRMATGMSGGARLLEDFWERMDQYGQQRDFPAIKGPSYLSVHLRFGTVSIRELVNLALQRQIAGSQGASVWLGELIWRDFYFQILANFPHVDGHAFKPVYDQIVWEASPRADVLFAAWCAGRTGYPLVDAAMRQLNHSGYMHNRLRMVAGSFLVKHLGVDWRWGERYFAEQLNDFDLAANNGGWQWVSSSGCDAQPYFRIFNPITQSEKFDAQGQFIRRYVPELAPLSAAAIHAPWQAKPLELAQAGLELGRDYPRPIVDHATARAATLQRYSVVRSPTQDGSSAEGSTDSQ